MSDSERDESEEQVFIRFVTRLDDYRVTGEKILVPKKLRRLGLSQLVNHLLGSQDDPVPFDFLIKNKFLRTSLKTHLKKHHISEEDAVEIEYVFALGAPETVDSLPHNDWVSALDHHQSAHPIPVLLSGAYDGIVRIWTPHRSSGDKSSNKSSALNLDSDRLLAEIKGHTAAVKALSTAHVGPSTLTVVSASQDATLRVNAVHVDSTGHPHVTHVSNLVGHTASVDDCDINSSGTLVASAGWDTKIKLWQLPKPGETDNYVITEGDLGDDDEDDGPKRKKKRRIEPSSTPKPRPEVNRRAVDSLAGHTGPVSAVRFASETELVSASWDHSIKFWDIPSAVVTTTIVAKDVLQCLSYHAPSQLLLTGHADGTVRLWDRRAQHAEVATMFSSHSIWVSAVAFHPTRPGVFASASYDATAKLWDMRSRTPLSTISDQHTEKILCAEWRDETMLLTGAADKLLKAHIVR